MKYTPIILLISFGISSQVLLAQHIKIDKKALSFLASEELVNIEFSYNQLKFNADSIPEPTYLKEIEVKVREKYGEQGVKDWMEKFNSSKQLLWPEAFTNTLNEQISEYEFSPKFEINNKNARYTLKVNTSWMYFGYNVVAAKWPSKINLELTFYETNNPQNVIISTVIRRAMGKNNQSYNLDGWSKFNRVKKAYIKGAYKLAQALKRVLD
jgi:hypothetical protein